MIEIAWIVDFTMEDSRRRGSTVKRLVWWRTTVTEIHSKTTGVLERITGSLLYDESHGLAAYQAIVSLRGRFLRHTQIDSEDDVSDRLYQWRFCNCIRFDTEKNIRGAKGLEFIADGEDESDCSWTERDNRANRGVNKRNSGQKGAFRHLENGWERIA